jgi:hypothetical protein
MLLNLEEETHFLHFSTKNSQEIDVQISYGNKQISENCNTKFLGFTIDDKLSWGLHIDEIVLKLNKACFKIRSVEPFISFEALRMIFFSVHSIISYGIIFLGTSANSKIVFKIQRRIIGVIMNSDIKDSCALFKKLYILPFYSQYIFSILLFVVRNRGLFRTNSDVHNLNIRTNFDLHSPTANLTLFQKRICYSGIKMYKQLPVSLKQLSYDVNKFKLALQKCLFTDSFYSLEEYFTWK